LGELGSSGESQRGLEGPKVATDSRFEEKVRGFFATGDGKA